jgi:cytochrome c biogenesis protein CcmG/thiol:disulfide interchange protein DsbE
VPPPAPPAAAIEPRPRRRRRLLVGASLAVAASAAVVAAAVLSASGGGADASPFSSAEAFTLPPVIAGQPPAVLAGAPGRPVVVNFFAAWCVPCRQELPLLERLHRGGTGQGGGAPVVVGIDEQDQRPDGPDLVRQAGVTFPTGFDHDGTVGRQWAVDGLPITAFVAPDGRIVAYHRGELRQGQLDALVRRLMAASR